MQKKKADCMFLGFVVDMESRELQESIRDQWSLRMKRITKRELTVQNTSAGSPRCPVVLPRGAGVVDPCEQKKPGSQGPEGRDRPTPAQ